MKRLKDLLNPRGQGPLAMVTSVLLGSLLVAGLVQAATTISTSIATDGNLAVAGIANLGGYASTTIFSVNNTAYFGGSGTTTIGVTGAITSPSAAVLGTETSGRASTTVLSVNNTAYFGGTATTTFTPAGNIVQGHTNTATTSITVGCIQTYATSTLTPVRLEFGVNNMASTTFRTGAAIAIGGGGQMVWVYGTCP